MINNHYTPHHNSTSTSAPKPFHRFLKTGATYTVAMGKASTPVPTMDAQLHPLIHYWESDPATAAGAAAGYRVSRCKRIEHRLALPACLDEEEEHDGSRCAAVRAGKNEICQNENQKNAKEGRQGNYTPDISKHPIFLEGDPLQLRFLPLSDCNVAC
jgi:hypothetical protein